MVPFLIKKSDFKEFINGERLKYDWNEIVCNPITRQARRLKESDLSSTGSKLCIVIKEKTDTPEVVTIEYDSISFKITDALGEKDVSNWWHEHLINIYGTKYANYGVDYAEVRFSEMAQTLYANNKLTEKERKEAKCGGDKLYNILQAHRNDLSYDDKTNLNVLLDLQSKSKRHLNAVNGNGAKSYGKS